ncbi:MAG: MauE/DoxX family redox-associated membrane protein [Geobacteraceae bacterium]|nr:MauE/DoxX family redox-associated membrane protein [Geobacteraceae bacterium]
MKNSRKHLLMVLLRIGLGLVFVYASFWKIRDPEAFAGSVAAYNVLPFFLNHLVAATLPWIEATCGILLISGYRVKAAAGIVVALNIIFIVLLVSTVARGLDIDCGCFRQGGGKTPAWLVILRDFIFLAMAVSIFKYQRGTMFSRK